MRKLDPSRPHGQVCGHCPYAYEQDGRFFLPNGNECDAEGREIKDPVVDPIAAPVPAAPTVAPAAPARLGRKTAVRRTTFEE